MWNPQCDCYANDPEMERVFAVCPDRLFWSKDAIEVLAYEDGSISNRWADGTVGVTRKIREEAEACESAYCPNCWIDARWTGIDREKTLIIRLGNLGKEK